MSLARGGLLSLFGILAALPAIAQVTDPYAITAAEKSACQIDAARLCSGTYPDEMKLITCMRTNRESLSSNCRRVFDAGLKRRGMQ